MNEIDLIQRNADRLAEKTAKYLQSQIENEPPTKKGYYRGYDLSLDKHEIRLEDGSSIWCKSITNGALAIGTPCQVTIPEGGTPFVKVMPR